MEVDLKRLPSILKDPHVPGREIYLDWAGAIDDEYHLRKCPVCNCQELFVRKDVPQLTAFVLVLVAAAIATGLFAADKIKESLLVLVIVIVIDLAIFFFSPRQVVCYQCRSEFGGLPIAINQKNWEAAIGERYRKRAIGTPREKSLAGGLFNSKSGKAGPVVSQPEVPQPEVTKPGGDPSSDRPSR